MTNYEQVQQEDYRIISEKAQLRVIGLITDEFKRNVSESIEHLKDVFRSNHKEIRAGIVMHESLKSQLTLIRFMEYGLRMDLPKLIETGAAWKEQEQEVLDYMMFGNEKMHNFHAISHNNTELEKTLFIRIAKGSNEMETIKGDTEVLRRFAANIVYKSNIVDNLIKDLTDIKSMIILSKTPKRILNPYLKSHKPLYLI